MLDIQLLRTDLAHVARVLATRNYAFPTTEFSALEAERKNLQTYTEELQARRYAASRQIGIA
jgi:seryl-tRNA synthetase